ncbi:hypothetical protein Ae201684_016233 [Aphanomyces euteiches]|uniref:Protein kinase domain-containing protein n=1 Tax=Aphanomyces euteiches TaxID=100861 RepID=A0A6G0WD60_9STRA|nr:hypothetical protein Ae201684_016233 [Aphanomyces euteiches]KAH9153508.1 hypothetical protein AeRB84_004254 [Aphanomyces euteiches]
MSSLLLSYVFLVFDVQAQGVTLPVAPTTAAPTTTPIPPTTVVPPTTEPTQATTSAPPPTPPSVTPTSVPPTPSTSVQTPSTSAPTTTLSTTNIPKQSPSTTTTATPLPSSSDTAVPTTQATEPLSTPSTSESPSLTPQPQISETNITNSTTAPATTNATLPPSSTPSSSLLSSGEIAGIIAGVAIFMSFLLYCAIMTWRRRRRQNGMESTLSALASTTSGIKEDTLDWGELEHFRVPLDEIELTKSIAAGGFGDVWLGRFRGQVVAVKTCQKSSRKQLQDFIHELVLTGSFQCDEIVTLLGAAWLRPMDLQAVLEYMNLGDVKTMLDNSASSPSLWPFHAKLECALSVAKALVYLKANHVIHRDLKSRNILLDSAKGTKLADFGISRHDTSSETMTAGVGTYRWMAPEVLTFKQYSTSVDVFSFGVVLSELDTHELPYANLRHEVSHGHGGRGEILSDSAIMHLFGSKN